LKEKYEVWILWVFECFDFFIFLSCYVFASPYPIFAFIYMALFNSYAMILNFFFGPWSLSPLFLTFSLLSLKKKMKKSKDKTIDYKTLSSGHV